MRDLVLLGASGLAREVASADQGDYRVVGILDDSTASHGRTVGGVEVLGGIDMAAGLTADLLVCIGSGVGRRNVVERLRSLGVGDARYGTVVDASVRVPPSCSVGAGSILLARVVLTADVTVRRHVVVMPNSTLTHDNVVADYVTIAAGVALGGSVHLGTGSYIGMNASIRQHVRVGAEATVGMGSAVLGSVGAGETWFGVPAQRRAITAPGSNTERILDHSSQVAS
jgi:sugar O-acyltransferase (sialic acid O-acetyltransferase NeuD family)